MIDKMWYMHAMGYYSSLKGKQILTDVATWMNIEDIMPSEINQSQKDKGSLTLTPGFRSSQSHRDTGWNSGFQKLDIEGKWELFDRYLISFL